MGSLAGGNFYVLQTHSLCVATTVISLRWALTLADLAQKRVSWIFYSLTFYLHTTQQETDRI